MGQKLQNNYEMDFEVRSFCQLLLPMSAIDVGQRGSDVREVFRIMDV